MLTHLRRMAVGLFCSAALVIASYPVFAQSITTPNQFFGFEPGADGMLFGYEKMIDYLKLLEKQCSRVKLFNIGTSALGRPIYMVCISDEENLKNLDELKEINRKLALEPNLSQSELNELKGRGKVFFLGTLSMHSTEVAPAQAAPVVAYKLATSRGTDTLAWLKNVVYMMVPCHNPDGMNMVNENYMKNKGSKFEGTNLPGVYHKYVGHNINRDFITLTQPENKAVSNLTSIEWFPQVMVEKHQMGSTGARYFVPPNHDPIAQNIDENLWSWIGLFGANMLNDMTAMGQKGISQRYIFDNYWPGSTETCLWKNVIAFLTEGASVKTASPIYIEKNELKVWGKGLSEYKKGANFIAPWEGGWWRLSDLVLYELSSTFSIIRTASLNREKILQHRNDMCRREVAKGLNQAPFYFIFSQHQTDRSELGRLVSLLREHGVEVNRLSADLLVDNRKFRKGDIVVPLAQPFRAFIKEVLERQEYPERRYVPGGEIIKPYDVTSWSLPLSMGLNCSEVNTRSIELENAFEPIDEFKVLGNAPGNSKHMVFCSSNNESFRVAFAVLAKGGRVFRTGEASEVEGQIFREGSFVISTSLAQQIGSLNLQVAPFCTNTMDESKLKEIKLPAIGLVETYFHDMDAGWTRYIFDKYSIPYRVIRPVDLAGLNLTKEFKIIVFPSQNADLLTSGKRKRDDDYYPMNLPPEFAQGMGKKGKSNLLKFIDEGGKVISWGQSTELFMGTLEIELDKDRKEEFTLPIQNVAKGLQRNGLEIIEAHVNVSVKPGPFTWGMPSSIPILMGDDVVFETSVPYFDTDRRVVLEFPTGDPRLSGYVKKGELLENRAAVVWVQNNKGQLILMAFSPQFRGSTPVSYKLLFNALIAE